jgi:hypothetical protein
MPKSSDPVNAVSLWDMPADVAAEIAGTLGKEPWIGARGQVWRASYGNADDQRAYTAIHRTPLIGPNPAYEFRWRNLDVETIVAGDYNLTVRTFVGPANGQDASGVLSLKAESDPLGEFILGTSPLGSALYTHQNMRLPRIIGRYIAFEVQFTGRTEFALLRLTPYYERVGSWRRPT